jgi:hypothetical protein
MFGKRGSQADENVANVPISQDEISSRMCDESL